jgi:general secretion pathway protein C
MQGLSAPFSQVPEASSALLNSLSGASTVTAADKTLVAQALGAPTSKLSPSANAALDANPSHQWTLLGVVAGSSGRGSALLLVDGQPPKAYLPGQTVAPGWVLHSVGHRVARLSSSLQESPTVVLDMPKQDN